jgi:hypothetical protein
MSECGHKTWKSRLWYHYIYPILFVLYSPIYLIKKRLKYWCSCDGVKVELTQTEIGLLKKSLIAVVMAENRCKNKTVANEVIKECKALLKKLEGLE